MLSIKEFISILLNVIAVLYLTTIITGLLMKVANYVGEQIGIYKIMEYTWNLIRKTK